MTPPTAEEMAVDVGKPCCHWQFFVGHSNLLTRIDKASYEILVVVEEMYRLGEYAGNQKMFSEWIGKLNKIAEDMTKGITING